MTIKKALAWVSLALIAGSILFSLAYGLNLTMNGEGISPATVCDIIAICKVNMMSFVGRYMLNMVFFTALGLGLGFLTAKKIIPNLRAKKPLPPPKTQPAQPQYAPVYHPVQRREVYRY